MTKLKTQEKRAGLQKIHRLDKTARGYWGLDNDLARRFFGLRDEEQQKLNKFREKKSKSL